MCKQSIYLASPFFNEYERELVKKFAKILREAGHDVFVPMEHFIPNGEELPNHIWGKKVFKIDADAINASNLVIALYHGLYSDSGTAWEIGYAYGIGLPVFVIHVNKDIEASVMPVNSATLNVTLDEFSVDCINGLRFGNNSNCVEQK